MFAEGLEDATKIVELKPDWQTGHYLQGLAYHNSRDDGMSAEGDYAYRSARRSSISASIASRC
jgi:hypothetical protein